MAGQQPVQVYNAPSNSFFIDLLDHERFLERQEHIWRGETLTEEQVIEDGEKEVKLIWKRKFMPKMNDYGVVSVVSSLRAICEKIIAITDFDEEQLDILALQNVQDFTDRLVENWYTFGFKTISDLNEVDTVGRNLILAQFRRSVDGQTLRALTSNTELRIVENRGGQEEEQPNVVRKRGLIGLRVPKFRV